MGADASFNNRRVQMVVVPVVILLDAYRVEANLHLPQDAPRFSDAWEAVMRDSREYIPVTDAEISTIQGTDVVGSPFIEIRKADIRAVFPTNADS
ncbi:MAG: hypothetical protein M3198_17550 [Actinomycetota bacterium]|nr:hypothetical protein [Actinomycetota bacterium]